MDAAGVRALECSTSRHGRCGAGRPVVNSARAAIAGYNHER
jgi:hypothetical protein